MKLLLSVKEMDRRFAVEEFEAQRFSGFFGKETESVIATLLTDGACNSNYLVETSKKEKFVCRIHHLIKQQTK